MDRLVDETEALGGAVSSPALTASRAEQVPEPPLNILSSFTAGDLTGKAGAWCAAARARPAPCCRVGLGLRVLSSPLQL